MPLLGAGRFAVWVFRRTSILFNHFLLISGNYSRTWACREAYTLISVGFFISSAMRTSSAAFIRSTDICGAAMEKTISIRLVGLSSKKAISVVDFFDVVIPFLEGAQKGLFRGEFRYCNTLVRVHAE
jgi:hypothetical protein